MGSFATSAVSGDYRANGHGFGVGTPDLADALGAALPRQENREETPTARRLGSDTRRVLSDHSGNGDFHARHIVLWPSTAWERCLVLPSTTRPLVATVHAGKGSD